EGGRIDAAAFERMSPEDAEIVRTELTPVPLDDRDAGFFERDDVILLDDEVDEQAEELARLNDELEDCRRRQRAFEAYLAALAWLTPVGASDGPAPSVTSTCSTNASSARSSACGSPGPWISATTSSGSSSTVARHVSVAFQTRCCPSATHLNRVNS